MIDLLPSADEQQILDSFQSFFAGEAPLERLRRPPHAGMPHDATLWPAMAELGWFALGLPEEQGGIGCGPVEQMLLLREAGRHLLSPALLATVLAAHVAADGQQLELLGRILAGQSHVGLALPAAPGQFQLHDTTPGGLALCWSAAWAQLLPVSAFTDAIEVDGLDDSVQVHLATLGNVRPLVSCEAATLEARVHLLTAAMLVGVAEGARDLSVAYAKVREQFGKPIGSFQAIKHACVDMALRVEAGRSQVAFAALALLHRPASAGFDAMAAKLIAADAAIENGTRSITLHGGMGFTAECDAHHFLKRAHLLSHVGGNARIMQARIAQLTRPESF